MNRPIKWMNIKKEISRLYERFPSLFKIYKEK